MLAPAAIRVNIYIYCHGGAIGTGQDTAGPLPDLRSPPLPGHPQAVFASRETNERSVGWCESLHMGNLNSLPSLKPTAKALKMDGWNTIVSFWEGHFQVQTVSFTECKFPTSISFRNQDFMIEFYAQKKRILIGISMDVRFGRNETSQSVPRNHDQSTPAANTLQTFCLHTLVILLMEEILHHLGCKDPVNNRINYQPRLVQDFFYQQ